MTRVSGHRIIEAGPTRDGGTHALDLASHLATRAHGSPRPRSRSTTRGPIAGSSGRRCRCRSTTRWPPWRTGGSTSSAESSGTPTDRHSRMASPCWTSRPVPGRRRRRCPPPGAAARPPERTAPSDGPLTVLDRINRIVRMEDPSRSSCPSCQIPSSLRRSSGAAGLGGPGACACRSPARTGSDTSDRSRCGPPRRSCRTRTCSGSSGQPPPPAARPCTG